MATRTTDIAGKKKPSTKPPLRKAIAVWCLADEKAVIERHAKQTAMSASAFLRALGMGLEPKSTIDQQSIRALAKINGDQGRLGGLLKLYLTNDEKLKRSHDPVALVSLINVLLDRLADSQLKLLALVTRLEGQRPGVSFPGENS